MPESPTRHLASVLERAYTLGMKSRGLRSDGTEHDVLADVTLVAAELGYSFNFRPHGRAVADDRKKRLLHYVRISGALSHIRKAGLGDEDVTALYAALGRERDAEREAWSDDFDAKNNDVHKTWAAEEPGVYRAARNVDPELDPVNGHLKRTLGFLLDARKATILATRSYAAGAAIDALAAHTVRSALGDGAVGLTEILGPRGYREVAHGETVTAIGTIADFDMCGPAEAPWGRGVLTLAMNADMLNFVVHPKPYAASPVVLVPGVRIELRGTAERQVAGFGLRVAEVIA